jgi:hypothetical protein
MGGIGTALAWEQWRYTGHPRASERRKSQTVERFIRSDGMVPRKGNFMPTTTFADFSAASRKTTLSAKLVKILHLASRGAEPDGEAKATARRGAELLNEIIQGSLLIERKPLEAGVVADLDGYSHALRSLPRQAPRSGEPSTVFKLYHVQLDQLAQGTLGSAELLTEMSLFFRSLSDHFFRDMRGVPADRPGAALSVAY